MLILFFSGTPSPDVQWSKNGTKLEASKRVSLTQKDVVYVLDIPNSLSSDSGTYTVTLKNPVGEASHDVSVMVTIPEVPPSIVKSSPSISISEGQDVHVEFIVAGRVISPVSLSGCCIDKECVMDLQFKFVFHGFLNWLGWVCCIAYSKSEANTLSCYKHQLSSSLAQHIN